MQDENNYYTQPNGNQSGGEPYGSPNYGQGYGQPNQQNGSQYGQSGQQYGDPYSQSGQQYGSPYNQSGQQYESPYGQQQYGYSSYGQQYQQGMGYGMGMAPFDPNGKPIPNRFGMKLTFSIFEMLSCNIFTMVCGIIGCIFTVKANTAYRERQWEDFKNHAKASAIALWIGFGLFILTLAAYLAISFAGMGESEDESVYVGNGEAYVYVDGTYIDIPTSYDEMMRLGFYLSREDGSEMLEAGDVSLCKMYNSDGEPVMWCWFYNTGISTRDVADCPIIGVNVDNKYCENYNSFRTDKGLGFHSSVRDFMEAYGVPDDVRDVDYGRTKYVWYLGDKDDPIWRVMEVTFEDGDLYEIDVDFKR